MTQQQLLRWEFGDLRIIKLFNKYRGHLDFKILREKGENFEDLIERGTSDEEIMENYWKIRNSGIGLIRWDKDEKKYFLKINPEEFLKLTEEEINFIVKTAIEINNMELLNEA